MASAQSKSIVEPQLSKDYELTGKPISGSVSIHSLPVVLFEPEHLRLLSGGPERRRDYLDDLWSKPWPATVRRADSTAGPWPNATRCSNNTAAGHKSSLGMSG